MPSLTRLSCTSVCPPRYIRHTYVFTLSNFFSLFPWLKSGMLGSLARRKSWSGVRGGWGLVSVRNGAGRGTNFTPRPVPPEARPRTGNGAGSSMIGPARGTETGPRSNFPGPRFFWGPALICGTPAGERSGDLSLWSGRCTATGLHLTLRGPAYRYGAPPGAPLFVRHHLFQCIHWGPTFSGN